MGYEIEFSFHERKEEGGYNVESVKTMKKVVGKATDDTPLEQLAKVLFGQLARRDIWVVSCEIHEYTKKKVSFKETKEGIILKHKKFSFDLTCSAEDIGIDIEEIAAPNNHAIVAQQQQTVIPPPKPKILRMEIYDPHPDIVQIAKIRVKNFTIGKQYPIFEEIPAPGNALLGMNYITEDDLGNRRTLNDKHFVPIVAVLERGFEVDDRSRSERNNMQYDNLPPIFTLKR